MLFFSSIAIGRWQEKSIAYSESHDQALVGDKTIAFWLMDKEMYWHMSALESHMHPIIDRGIALHKLIRLITCSLGGEGYLTFMGNEFGHPEWIDFPRAGNDWSYQHCRRQWNLVDDKNLLYNGLWQFEKAMLHLEMEYPWLSSRDSFVSLKHEDDKILVYERGTSSGHLVFVFNFHASLSQASYRIGVPLSGNWKLVLDTDSRDFAGHGRLVTSSEHPSLSEGWHGRPSSILIYSPCRSAQVYYHSL
jgi:1,4-alpha-glucan branching enzyme